MKKYILKRLLQLIPIFLLLTFIVFALMYLSGSDPASKKISAQGTAVTAELLNKMRKEMGLNRPFIVQYGTWLLDVMKGNFGISYDNNLPVLPQLMEGLRYTCVLALGTLVLSLLVSIPLGILTAIHRDSILDHVVRLLTFVANSMPNFLLAVLLMYFFCIRMKLFPVIASGSVQGLFLPAVTLAIPIVGRFIRQIRAEVLDQMGQPYIRILKCRGIKGNIILFHNIMHNALSSILTIIGLSIGTLMGGSVVVETVFRWPGIGSVVMDAITARDYPMVQGFAMIMALIYVVINLLIDISYAIIDPRVELR